MKRFLDYHFLTKKLGEEKIRDGCKICDRVAAVAVAVVGVVKARVLINM